MNTESTFTGMDSGWANAFLNQAEPGELVYVTKIGSEAVSPPIPTYCVGSVEVVFLIDLRAGSVTGIGREEYTADVRNAYPPNVEWRAQDRFAVFSMATGFLLPNTGKRVYNFQCEFLQSK